jgi:site-specific DNA recombinase
VITDSEVIGTIERITLRKGRIETTLHEMQGDADRLIVDWSPSRRIRRREIIAPDREFDSGIRPIGAQARMRLLAAIAKAKLWLDELVSGRVADILRQSQDARASASAQSA